MKCGCITEQLNHDNQTSFGECADKLLESVGCGKIDWTTGLVGDCMPGANSMNGAVDWAWSQISDLFSSDDDLPCNVFDPRLVIGGVYELWIPKAPPGGVCALGMQCNQCGYAYCNVIDNHGVGTSPGVCGCEAPYSAVRGGEDGTGNLYKCECKSPSIEVDGQYSVRQAGC